MTLSFFEKIVIIIASDQYIRKIDWPKFERVLPSPLPPTPLPDKDPEFTELLQLFWKILFLNQQKQTQQFYINYFYQFCIKFRSR
jgi:hypothetical protein